MGRLKWIAFGSPLSQHRHRTKYRERLLEDIEAGVHQPLLKVCTYPVEGKDPCSPCDCPNLPPNPPCKHISYATAENQSRSPYGEMKVRVCTH